MLSFREKNHVEQIHNYANLKTSNNNLIIRIKAQNNHFKKVKYRFHYCLLIYLVLYSHKITLNTNKIKNNI